MSRPILFYDSDCGSCTRTARWLERSRRMDIEPFDSPLADQYLGHVEPEYRFSRAWLSAGGQLYDGHEAVWHALYLLPAGRLLRPLRWIPGFQPVSRALYRWVADHRSTSCTLDQSSHT